MPRFLKVFHHSIKNCIHINYSNCFGSAETDWIMTASFKIQVKLRVTWSQEIMKYHRRNIQKSIRKPWTTISIGVNLDQKAGGGQVKRPNKRVCIYCQKVGGGAQS